MNFEKYEKIFSSISITKEHSPPCLSLSLGFFQYTFIRHIFHHTLHTLHGNPSVTYENLFFKKLKKQINKKNAKLKKIPIFKIHSGHSPLTILQRYRKHKVQERS